MAQTSSQGTNSERVFFDGFHPWIHPPITMNHDPDSRQHSSVVFSRRYIQSMLAGHRKRALLSAPLAPCKQSLIASCPMTSMNSYSHFASSLGPIRSLLAVIDDCLLSFTPPLPLSLFTRPKLPQRGNRKRLFSETGALQTPLMQ